jgi:pectate lyase
MTMTAFHTLHTLLGCLLLAFSPPATAGDPAPAPAARASIPSSPAQPAPSRARRQWSDYARNSAEWFSSPAALEIATNILSHQAPGGSWPKNTDTFGTRFAGSPNDLHGTFDNSATVGECRFLNRVAQATGEPRFRIALDRALDLVLAAQYPNGGWPQSHPPGTGYPRHITFNDGTMVNILRLMRDVAESPEFDRIDPDRRARARAAFDRGIDCILRCQIRRGDTLTVWCAQHDEQTLEPRKARSYEHPSLSGAESAGIVRLLMSLPAPRPEVVRAVDAACAWFDTAKLTGIRQVQQNGDKTIVSDPAAPPLWARFYAIESNRPMFSGRDGVIRSTLAEIEPERRNGYAWYGDWGRSLLDEYRAWKKTVGKPSP